MEYLRYVAIGILLICNVQFGNNEAQKASSNYKKPNKNCPYTKTVEEVFKVRNITLQSGNYAEDSERAKQFLSAISNVTANSSVNNRTVQEDQVNNIIASINRIKDNITTDAISRNANEQLNEAIILNVPESQPINKIDDKLADVTQTEAMKDIKEDVYDSVSQHNISAIKDLLNITKDSNRTKGTNLKENTTYVEIMTIEPNNANKHNSSSHNLIEMLKHLMPMFNSTITKELHNITVIERDRSKNHSFSEVKNISTIIVTYCDHENLTKANMTNDNEAETTLKVPRNATQADDYFMNSAGTDGSLDEEMNDDAPEDNLSVSEKKDLLEATEYGMQKMHELYTIMEPKLYSMGFWLDDSNPARYVAAFNAPGDDAARYARYGYASLQAAAKLRQLTSGGNNDGLESRMEEAHFPSADALRQSPLMQQCPIRGQPKCPPASKRYRTHDGTCNNFNRPRWGSTMTPVQRFLTPAYSDGLQAPRRSVLGPKLPSAREISSLIHEDQHVEATGITHLLMQWGQFLDHDITSSSQSRGFNGSVPRCCKDGGKDFVSREFMHPECMPISVPPSDPFYGPRGVRCLDFVRSSPAPHDDCSLGWREQLNQVSAYIDGSPLYGTSARKSDKLRLFRNGMLQYGRVQQRRPLLPPERKDELCRGGAVSTDCFKSGDARVNEHPGLVAAHIVWLRQHNRMAQELAHLNPQWSDEKIYQETRKIVGAMVQHISYKEFLPIVLGSEVMRLFDLEPLKKGFYKSYNVKINPSPASAFGSAAFRFGHSLVQPSFVRFDRFHRPMSNNVSLHNELTNPSNIWSMGAVDRLLLGMVNQPIQKRDEFITEELTNHLFQTPQFDFGMDLAAINVQRGRDHGVPAYTAWRDPCGLSQITEFEDLFRVMPAKTVRKMQALYKHVDDIDLFTGGMSERPVVGGLVGPTFACIIAQQFSNIRRGDRFWYENGGFDSSFTPAQLQQIRRITFAQVLCRTLDSIDNIQPFAFLSSDSPNNERIPCSNGHLNNFDLSPWVEINSDSNNDISKSDNRRHDVNLSEKTKDVTSTVTPTTMTAKLSKSTTMTKKVPQKKPPLSLFNSSKAQNSVTKHRPSNRLNLTDDNDKLDNTPRPTNKIQTKLPTMYIDDKLDFKNKSKRNDDFKQNEKNDRIDTRRRPAQQTEYPDENDYYDEENAQSVQSVVINNMPHRRPIYNRPNRPIAVTENTDKYTYLINYVPRSTQSWRQSTRRPYVDRDVVKVTYQTYDDTYRRPNKPYYYNRQDETDLPDNDYKSNNQIKHTSEADDFYLAARSNDDQTVDQSERHHISDTTDNVHKLVTFGYVGTYKRSETTKSDVTEKKDASISKDFSTYGNKDTPKIHVRDNALKLSTFYLYDTTTKSYNEQRSTRKDDDEPQPKRGSTNNKYYYVQNVLHKYPDMDSTLTDKTSYVEDEKDIISENYNSPGHPVYMDVQERSSADKLALLAEDEDKPKTAGSKIRKRPQQNVAKTPSVAFQVTPSENSASQWAVYEEDKNLPEVRHQMPIHNDPYALKEMPRPMDLMHIRRQKGKL